MGELLDNLEKHYETRKLKSLRSIKARGAHIRRAFGFRRAAQVTRIVIDNYIAARRAEKIKNKDGKVMKKRMERIGIPPRRRLTGRRSLSIGPSRSARRTDSSPTFPR